MPGSQMYQHLGALSACIGAICAGSTMGWTSAASSLTDTTQDFHITNPEFAWISAILSLGAVVGSIPIGTLANHIGRKKVLMLLSPCVLVGYLLLAWSNQLWMLLLGRFILGITAGAFCVVAPMYSSEIAEASIRGVLGTYFQFLITGGILFVYVLSALDVALFYVNIACACLPVALFCTIMLFPDSPRWSIGKGKYSDAEDALKFFRGHSNVQKELDSIKDLIEQEKLQKLPFSKAFSTPEAKKALFLGVSCMFFQQFSGINAVIFYSSRIFEAAHTSLKATLSTAIVGVCQILSTYVSTLLIDRLGRRLLLMFSGAGMAISAAVLGLYFFLDDRGTTKEIDIGWLPILCLVVFIVSFSLGIGPIPWLYMGEIFTDQIKGAGMSIATVVNWLSVFIVTKFYEDLANSIGSWSTFWIFSGISVVNCIFVAFFLVETKGKELSQILIELGASPQSQPANGARKEVHEEGRY